MSEVVLGDILARLRVDSSQFESTLNAAQQRLAQFDQTTQQTTQAQRTAAQTLLQEQRAAAQTALQAQRAADQTALQDKRAAQQVALQAQRAANQAILQDQRATYHTQLQAQRAATQQMLQVQREAAAEARAAQQQASAGGGFLGGALQIAGGIGIATGLGALVGQLKDFATSTVDVATRMQSLQASLSALGGSALAGAQQFAQLYQMAQGLGVAFEPLARGFRQLTAAATQAGLPLTEQQRLLQALATEGRRVGASHEELGRAITALAQVASKGKVSMEELRQQLGEALPTALAATAKGMGVTTAELEKMVETGTLEFVPFAKALRRGFEEMQQASGEFASGARQAFNQLGNAFLAFKDAVGANVLPELERLAKVATGILDTARALLSLVGGRRDPVLGPNTASEILGTPEQEAQVQRLRSLIERLQQPEPTTARRTGGPSPAERQAQLQRAQEELDILLETIQATKDQTAAERDENAERNKSASVLERQAAFNERLQKALAAVRTEEEKFREQARYAPNTLGDPQGTAAQQETFARARQKALEASVTKLTEAVNTRGAGVTITEEQAKAIRDLDVASKQYGDTVDRLKEQERARTKAVHDAEQAQKKAARDAAQDAETYQAAIDKTRMALAQQRDQALNTLERLRSAYSETKEARDVDTLATIEATYAQDEEVQASVAVAKAALERRTAYEAEVEALKERFTALKQNADAMRAHEDAATRFGDSLTETLERLQAPREERAELRLRAQARRQSVDITPEMEARLQAITQQERFNQIMEISQHLGDQVAQNLTTGLLNVAAGAERVGEAFKTMAKAILDSVSQLLVSEGFKLLLSVGIKALGAYFAPTTAVAGADASFASSGSGSGFLSGLGGSGTLPALSRAQGGAIVNRPTAILAGENPAMNPEYVLNRPQMQALMKGAMQAGPSAGGQAAGGISIINVSSKEEAERSAAQERALGRQVVINYVMDDLAAGAGSRIGRAIKVGQR